MFRKNKVSPVSQVPTPNDAERRSAWSDLGDETATEAADITADAASSTEEEKSDLAKNIAKLLQDLKIKHLMLDLQSVALGRPVRLKKVSEEVFAGKKETESVVDFADLELLKLLTSECKKLGIKTHLLSNLSQSLTSKILLDARAFNSEQNFIDGLEIDGVYPNIKFPQEIIAAASIANNEKSLLLEASQALPLPEQTLSVQDRIRMLGLENIVTFLGSEIGLNSLFNKDRPKNGLTFSILEEARDVLAEKLRAQEEEARAVATKVAQYQANSLPQEWLKKIEAIIYSNKSEQEKSNLLEPLLNSDHANQISDLNIIKDANGRSIAHILVAGDKKDLLMDLKRKGLYSSALDNNGNTPSLDAAKLHKYDILEALITSGADPRIANFRGGVIHNLVYEMARAKSDEMMQLASALDLGSTPEVPVSKIVSIIYQIAEKYPDSVNQQSAIGTPLHCAIANYSLSAFQAIIATRAVNFSLQGGLYNQSAATKIVDSISKLSQSSGNDEKIQNLFAMLSIVIDKEFEAFRKNLGATIVARKDDLADTRELKLEIDFEERLSSFSKKIKSLDLKNLSHNSKAKVLSAMEGFDAKIAEISMCIQDSLEKSRNKKPVSSMLTSIPEVDEGGIVEGDFPKLEMRGNIVTPHKINLPEKAVQDSSLGGSDIAQSGESKAMLPRPPEGKRTYGAPMIPQIAKLRLTKMQESKMEESALAKSNISPESAPRIEGSSAVSKPLSNSRYVDKKDR